MNSATVPQIDAYADVDGVGGGVAKKDRHWRRSIGLYS